MAVDGNARANLRYTIDVIRKKRAPGWWQRFFGVDYDHQDYEDCSRLRLHLLRRIGSSYQFKVIATYTSRTTFDYGKSAGEHRDELLKGRSIGQLLKEFYLSSYPSCRCFTIPPSEEE